MGPNKIEKFIFSIKNTHPIFKFIFENGGCFQFYLILKTIFPTAIPYYCVYRGHIFTKIGKYFYDINGKHLKIDDKILILKNYSSKKVHRWHKNVNLTLFKEIIKNGPN